MESDYKLFAAMKALIIKDGQVLLVREASTYGDGTNVGKWGVPGGRVHPGEHFADGLKREVLEEVGLNVEMKRPVYVDEWRPKVRGEQWHIVATFIECTPLSDNITLSDEHDQYAWVPLDKCHEYNLMAEDLKAIQTYSSIKR